MTGEFEYPSIGNETIDSLRQLQIRADAIDDPSLKKAFIKDSIIEVPDEDLLGQAFAVESMTVIGTLNAARPRRFLFTQGMRFFGRAARLNYLYNPNEMIDFLTVSFEEPTVVKPEVAAADFELFTFQVPVLAIDQLDEAA